MIKADSRRMNARRRGACVVGVLALLGAYGCTAARAPARVYVSHPATAGERALLRQKNENAHPVTVGERAALKPGGSERGR